MAGKGSRSFVTPGSDSRGNSNLNRTKKYQSRKTIKNLKGFTKQDAKK